MKINYIIRKLLDLLISTFSHYVFHTRSLQLFHFLHLPSFFQLAPYTIHQQNHLHYKKKNHNLNKGVLETIEIAVNGGSANDFLGPNLVIVFEQVRVKNILVQWRILGDAHHPVFVVDAAIKHAKLAFSLFCSRNLLLLYFKGFYTIYKIWTQNICFKFATWEQKIIIPLHEATSFVLTISLQLFL